MARKLARRLRRAGGASPFPAVRAVGDGVGRGGNVAGPGRASAGRKLGGLRRAQVLDAAAGDRPGDGASEAHPGFGQGHDARDHRDERQDQSGSGSGGAAGGAQSAARRRLCRRRARGQTLGRPGRPWQLGRCRRKGRVRGRAARQKDGRDGAGRGQMGRCRGWRRRRLRDLRSVQDRRPVRAVPDHAGEHGRLVRSSQALVRLGQAVCPDDTL